jgi:hypothetical protein
MTHIPVMTHFLVRRVMCRIQLRITHPAFGWWGLLIYSSVYDDALPLCAPHWSPEVPHFEIGNFAVAGGAGVFG